MQTILTSGFCMAVLVILLIGVALQKKAGVKQRNQFLFLLFSVEFFLAINLVSELIEGNEQYHIVLVILNLMSFFAVDIILLAFTAYLRALLRATEDKKYGLLYVVVASSLIRVATISVLFATNHLFAIENGEYIERDLISIPYIMACVLMLEFLLAILVYHKGFSPRQLVVVIVYLLLPVGPIVAEMYTNLYILTDMALTLSVILVYVLLQATTIEQARVRADVLEELSTTDLLTNLNNRRAYYQRISKIPPAQNVGVCFCDINGLKYANDHFGHIAGDELIRKFSKILNENFRKDDIFRISGDEFVVIVCGTTEADFLSHVHRFFNVVCDENRIAAIGHSFGVGACVERLVSDAEEAMYEDKRICGKSRNSAVEIK